MRILNYKAEQLGNVVIPLGVQGETGATLIRIDFSEWLMDGTDGYPVISVLDPEGVAYVAATYRGDEQELRPENEGETETGEAEEKDAAESAVINWPITDIDTVHFGDGAIRLLLYDPKGVILKSAVARTNLAPSFIKSASEPPENWEYWLQEAMKQTAESGSNRVLSQHAAEQAMASAKSASASEAAAMSYADIVKAAAAAAAEGTPLPDIVMNLTTTIPFSFQTSDWVHDESKATYTAQLTNGIVTGHVGAIFMPTEAGAENMNDGAVLKCSAGQVEVITGEAPGGTVSGTMILCGRFAPDGAQDDGAYTLTYWPRRAAISIGNVETVSYTQGAAASVREGNVLDLQIPAGECLEIGTVTTLPPVTEGSAERLAQATAEIVNQKTLNLGIPAGLKGATGSFSGKIDAIAGDSVNKLCDEVLSGGEPYVKPDADKDYFMDDVTSFRPLLQKLKAFFTPMARTVNGKALTGNITLAYTDVNAARVTVRTVELKSSSWASKAQTVNCAGVTGDNTVIVSPNATSYLNYHKWKVRCNGQGDGKLTFATDGTPSANLIVQILILDGTK